MIYDDQPQMVEAMVNRMNGELEACQRVATKHLKTAFAAIDREALIEKARTAMPRGYQHPDLAEAVLVAAGIIPERSDA
jgi:hypothetical protein